MPPIEINYIAVLVAAIIHMILGMVWFAMLIGPWLRAAGRTREDMQKRGVGAMYITSFVLALITAYVLAGLIHYAGARTLWEGTVTGFWVWLGFSAAMAYPEYLFSGRSKALFIINAGYQLLSLLAMGALLAVWT